MIFPLQEYSNILAGLRRREEIVFITYDDLDFGNDWNYQNGYPIEWKNWKNGFKKRNIWKTLREKVIRTNVFHKQPARRDPHKIYILLQHDCDSSPQGTLEMAELDHSMGVRSNIMLFSRWRDSSGDLKSYPVDWQRVKFLKEKGFTIGLHCNAYHNANFDDSLVFSTFRKDLEILEEKVGVVKFFSAHGGRLDALGRGNASFDYMMQIPNPPRWVHNRFSIRTNGTYSDGNLVARLRSNDQTINLGDWLKNMRPGNRYRILIHPQYYSRSLDK